MFDEIYNDYINIIDTYLSHNLTVLDFQKKYFNKFLNEKRQLDNDCYDLLNEMFGDLDCFTADDDLLNENPSFYLDERRLYEKAKIIIRKLRVLSCPNVSNE